MEKTLETTTGRRVLALVLAAVVAFALTAAPAALVAPQEAQAAVSTKTLAKKAKAVLKKAKATKGSTSAKLKKAYKYAANKSRYGYKASILYYVQQDMSKDKKGWWKSYANEMLSKKKGSCYNDAAMFAVVAKQAAGKKTAVRIGVGKTQSSMWNADATGVQDHAWVEVKIGGSWYIYDTNVGKNSTVSTYKGKVAKLKKSKASKLYTKAKYTTVTL